MIRIQLEKLLKNLKHFIDTKILPIPTSTIVNMVKQEELKVKGYILNWLYKYSKNTEFLDKLAAHYTNLILTKIKTIVAKIDVWKDELDRLADYYEAENLQKRLAFYKKVRIYLHSLFIRVYTSFKNVSLILYTNYKNKTLRDYIKGNVISFFNKFKKLKQVAPIKEKESITNKTVEVKTQVGIKSNVNVKPPL